MSYQQGHLVKSKTRIILYNTRTEKLVAFYVYGVWTSQHPLNPIVVYVYIFASANAATEYVAVKPVKLVASKSLAAKCALCGETLGEGIIKG